MSLIPFPTHPFTMTDLPRTAESLVVGWPQASRNGVLVRLFRNVYVVARSELTVERQRAYAASLVISRHSVDL